MGPVEGNRLMIVTAKVRGSGIVGPMVQAANGWTRLPQVTLSEKWQEVRIPRTLKAGTNQPVVYFVSLPLDAIQPGAIFEIADLRATLAPPLALADQEVRPKSFKPEDYAPGVPLVQEEDWRVFGSLRGGFVSEEIPFPQTRRPVMVYLRYRPASVKDRILIRTLRGGCKQGLREVAPASGGWQWLAFPNLSAEEAGEAITIDVRPDKAAGKPAGLGALVLATAPALGEDALDSLP